MRQQGSHIQPDFVLTQFLTGHGTFGVYFHRFTIQTETQCLCTCQESPETVKQILLDRPVQEKERYVLKMLLICCNITYLQLLHEVFKRACCKNAFRRYVSYVYKKL